MKLIRWFAGWYWACIVVWRFYHKNQSQWLLNVPSWFIQEILHDEQSNPDREIQMIVREAKQHASSN